MKVDSQYTLIDRHPHRATITSWNSRSRE